MGEAWKFKRVYTHALCFEDEKSTACDVTWDQNPPKAKGDVVERSGGTGTDKSRDKEGDRALCQHIRYICIGKVA